MTLQEQGKLAEHIIRILKVRHISFPIGLTEKGNLSIKYVKDEPGYQIILDAVPLDQKDYDNRELKAMLEKYLFEPNVVMGGTLDITKMVPLMPPGHVGILEKKKRGRPKKTI